MLRWVYRIKGNSGKILTELTKLKPTIQNTQEVARMCLTVTQGIEKKDILVLRKSTERQACNSSNWLLWWEFKFFSKWEAAILGAGVRVSSLAQGTRPLMALLSACLRPWSTGCGGGWKRMTLG